MTTCLVKSDIVGSSLFGCNLERGSGELPDTRDHLFGEQRDIFHCLPMRHVADMQVQNDLAALRLLAPEGDALRNLIRGTERRSVHRRQTLPGYFSFLDGSGFQAFP